MGLGIERKCGINCVERKHEVKNTQEYSDEEHLEFTVIFGIRGDGAEKRVRRLIANIVRPLKEEYPYAEICIEVNK